MIINNDTNDPCIIRPETDRDIVVTNIINNEKTMQLIPEIVLPPSSVEKRRIVIPHAHEFASQADLTLVSKQYNVLDVLLKDNTELENQNVDQTFKETTHESEVKSV